MIPRPRPHSPSGHPLRIGFLPLADAAPLVVAREKGCFARQGLEVELRKLQSWAQVRDRLLAGEVQAAHMLATMVLLLALEAAPGAAPAAYAYALSRDGTSIALSNALWKAGARDAAGLRAALAEGPGSGPLRFGVVFPRSSHEYFLRLWLRAAGLAAGARVSLLALAPQEMAGALREGGLDGFCAGEPWGQRASASKAGGIVAVTEDALPALPEKVLGVRADWHRERPGDHARLLLALREASAWLASPENREEAAALLASKRYVNTDPGLLLRALEGRLLGGWNRELRPARPLAFPGPDGGFPDRAHARWFLERMVEFGHARPAAAAGLDLGAVCLEGFHRQVLGEGAGAPAGAAPPGLRNLNVT